MTVFAPQSAAAAPPRSLILLNLPAYQRRPTPTPDVGARCHGRPPGLPPSFGSPAAGAPWAGDWADAATVQVLREKQRHRAGGGVCEPGNAAGAVSTPATFFLPRAASTYSTKAHAAGRT